MKIVIKITASDKMVDELRQLPAPALFMLFLYTLVKHFEEKKADGLL